MLGFQQDGGSFVGQASLQEIGFTLQTFQHPLKHPSLVSYSAHVGSLDESSRRQKTVELELLQRLGPLSDNKFASMLI